FYFPREDNWSRFYFPRENRTETNSALRCQFRTSATSRRPPGVTESRGRSSTGRCFFLEPDPGAVDEREKNRAGSPWGLLPRAPTDPDVRVKGASGSSRCGFAAPLTTQRPCGDTWRGAMPSAWFRPPVHNAVPPSLHGVREGPFPRFGTT